jgi:hypothetical protein
VVDRPEAGKVSIEVRRPSEFKEVVKDQAGNIKYAEIEYVTVDERNRTFTYTEVIEHPSAWGGDRTRFSTFRNGEPFAFSENLGGDGIALQTWEAPYDFVPVVHIPFIDIGGPFGSVAFRRTLTKIDAANGLASQLSDQVAKIVATPYAIIGAKASDMEVNVSKEDVPLMFISSPDVKIQALLSDMDLADAVTVLSAAVDEIKEDLPELRMAEALRTDMSGEALSRAFSDVFAQVEQVRANHDGALVRAHNMGVAIGGEFGYDDAFSGFSLDSYNKDDLRHSIGARPVLPRSTLELTRDATERWTQLNMAVESGLPLEVALIEIMEWSEERVGRMVTDMRSKMEFLTNGVGR